jgi:hypothetical protein
MNRQEELAKGLAKLQDEMAHMMNHVAIIQDLVPVIDFGSMINRADNSDDLEFEARTASPPSVEYPYQVPMFEYEPPITIVFEKVIISGEAVDLEEMEQIDGSDS